MVLWKTFTIILVSWFAEIDRESWENESKINGMCTISLFSAVFSGRYKGRTYKCLWFLESREGSCWTTYHFNSVIILLCICGDNFTILYRN